MEPESHGTESRKTIVNDVWRLALPVKQSQAAEAGRSAG